MYKLIDNVTGQEIKVGEKIVSTVSGATWILEAVYPTKVEVSQDGFKTTKYPGVFDAKIK